MSADLELFTYDDATHIRALRDDEGEPAFIAADVARALRYRMASDMTRRIDECDKGYAKVRTPGGDQDMATVNESGLYTAIFRANSEHAQEFRRWVTRTVLPAIRKTGTYSRYPAQPHQLPSKKELAQWVVEAEERAESAERARLEAERHAAELQPSAAAWNELAEAGADYAIDDAAKVLSRDPNINIGKLRLFAYMAGMNWIYRGSRSRWRAYQSQVDLGRLAEKVGKPYWCDTLGKLVTPEPTIRITSKGLAELYRLLGGGTQLELVASS